VDRRTSPVARVERPRTPAVAGVERLRRRSWSGSRGGAHRGQGRRGSP